VHKLKKKMNNIYNLILLILFLPIEKNICTCPPPANWRKATPSEYNYSNDVFIGDVKLIPNSQVDYEIVVCEVFKGDLKSGQTIKGEKFGTCGPYVNKNGEWVLFGTYSTKFKVNDCGISSNINDPRGLLPPPPPPNSEIEEKVTLKSRKLEARKHIKKQINMLRNISKSK